MKLFRRQPAPDQIIIATLETGEEIGPIRAGRIDWRCPGAVPVDWEVVKEEESGEYA